MKTTYIPGIVGAKFAVVKKGTVQVTYCDSAKDASDLAKTLNTKYGTI